MKKIFLLSMSLYFSFGLFAVSAQEKKSLNWAIRSTEWSRTHERNYQEFIARLGEAREKGLCRTTDECLRDPRANPLYAAKNPPGLRSIFADCADLPHILMAYFAWMNDLPFSYVSGVSKARWRLEELQQQLAQIDDGRRFFVSREVRELRREIKDQEDRIAKEDIRYTRDGNSVRERRTVRNGDHINEILQHIVGTISTATYRMHANKYDSGNLFKDMYHVRIDREGIVPGTVLYDPAGHIAVVYKVTSDGRVFLIDAHPDNSLTRVSFGEKFARSPDLRGAGFVQFRPYSLEGSRFNSSKGVYEGGVIRPKSNRELPLFSLEQFYGSPVRLEATLQNARYNLNGVTYSYYDYVRRKLSIGDLKINPVEDFKNSLEDLCLDLKDRKDAVDKAIQDGISAMSAPDRLPENIYGTHGTWETYSTPSRDARFKASVKSAFDNVNRAVGLYRQGSSEVVYQGADLVGDIEEIYEEVTRECEVEVKGSDARLIRISLQEAIERLFDLSFDPYHCVELRWGLTDPQSLATCNSPRVKLDWYYAQARLRNVIERDYALRMDYTLRELPSAPIGTNERPVFRLPR